MNGSRGCSVRLVRRLALGHCAPNRGGSSSLSPQPCRPYAGARLRTNFFLQLARVLFPRNGLWHDWLGSGGGLSCLSAVGWFVVVLLFRVPRLWNGWGFCVAAGGWFLVFLVLSPVAGRRRSLRSRPMPPFRLLSLRWRWCPFSSLFACFNALCYCALCLSVL